MLTPIGTRQLMPRTSAERGGVCGAWLRQKYKPTFKRESSAPLNFVASCAELRFLARVDARWCRREKYKQIRRKTLLYAFERRMKACQSAWRRRKYKPTFTPELPVHVVLVPPLLFPPPSPALVVIKKIGILLVPATALSSRRFFTRCFLQHRRHTPSRGRLSDGTSQWSWTRHLCSRHNGYHMAYCIHDIDECKGSHYISFMFRQCESSRSFSLVFTYAGKLVAQLIGCASSTSQAFARMRWRRTSAVYQAMSDAKLA